MRDAKRELEIKEEIARLKTELKEFQGEFQLELKNRRLVKYPYVGCIPPDVTPHHLHHEEISNTVRKVLTATGSKLKNGNRYVTKPKQVNDLTKEEYNAVCECTDKLLEILNEYNEKLHPNGIYKGNYTEGMELYL